MTDETTGPSTVLTIAPVDAATSATLLIAGYLAAVSTSSTSSMVLCR
jgi:hypothetical protein